MSRRTRLLPLGVAALLALVLPGAAGAAYPSSNGKLAFSRDGQIWAMNPDGTSQTRLTPDNPAAPSTDPEWSPDGTRVAFTRGFAPQRRLAVMNADGSGESILNVFIPDLGGEAYAPTWSPDGRRLAYTVSFEDNENCFCPQWAVYSVELDGSPDVQGYGWSDGARDGSQWSPRGTTVAISEVDVFETGLELIRKLPVTSPNTDGGPIGNGPLRDFGPAWSPDAAKVAYIAQRNDVTSCEGSQPSCAYEVQVANADNTGIARLTSNGAAEYGVEWSPDGSKLAYSGVEPGCSGCANPDLHVMNPDGTGRVRVTNTAAGEFDPDWQPVIVGPGPGFPRPKGASPLRASLVPAYVECTSPNRSHGPPLGYGSCNPPSLRSARLTVGTPDANGPAANMSGHLLLKVLGASPVPADDAELRIAASIDDVRCQPPNPNPCSTIGNTHPLPDYTGELTARLSLRLTDRYNLPSPAGRGAGTMTNTAFDIRLSCAATAPDPSIGSTCSVTTTGNAISPGLVVEGRRSVWALGDVVVFDGDPNSGATPFLRQGLFVP